MATTDPTLVAQRTPVSEVSETVVGRSPWELFWLRFRQDRAALVGLGFIALLVILAVTAPLIARFIVPPTRVEFKCGEAGEATCTRMVDHGPNTLFADETDEYGLPKGPNGQFWLGADKAGRDVFVRVLYGARTSLFVGVLCTAISMVIGIVLGMVAGYTGGWLDTVISRFTDMVLSMPVLVFALGISAACGVTSRGCLGGIISPGLPLVIFIVVLFSWTYIARIVRGQTLALREREFVEAARASGASHMRIMLRELLPNLVAPIVIYATLLIPSVILFEAYLTYLGLGLPFSIPSWGGMVSEATGVYREAWWFMFFPGLFLLMTTLAFNLLGDGLRDAIDPRTVVKGAV